MKKASVSSKLLVHVCLAVHCLSFLHWTQEAFSKYYRTNKLMNDESEPPKYSCWVPSGTSIKWLQDWFKLKWIARPKTKRLHGARWYLLFWAMINWSLIVMQIYWYIHWGMKRKDVLSCFLSTYISESWEMVDMLHIYIVYPHTFDIILDFRYLHFNLSTYLPIYVCLSVIYLSIYIHMYILSIKGTRVQ